MDLCRVLHMRAVWLLRTWNACGAGPWQDAVGAFAACGYQCPQYKNPSDYFMKVVSDTGSHGALVDAQSSRWASTRRMAFASFRSGVRGPAGNNGRGTEIHKEGDAPLEEVKVDGAARLTQDDLVDHEVRFESKPWRQWRSTVSPAHDCESASAIYLTPSGVCGLFRQS